MQSNRPEPQPSRLREIFLEATNYISPVHPRRSDAPTEFVRQVEKSRRLSQARPAVIR